MSQVGQGHMCLWCSEKGKNFQTAAAVQKHMVDKGHCRLRHEGETLIGELSEPVGLSLLGNICLQAFF
jgi:hypothetical protein